MNGLELEELVMDIAAAINHGECLYELDMFNDLINDIDKLKQEVVQQFKNNQDV